MAAELLSRVPKTHKLRDLVTAFLEAGDCRSVHAFDR